MLFACTLIIAGWENGAAANTSVPPNCFRVESPPTVAKHSRSEPKQSEIDLYHTLLLDSFKDTFNTHKAAYGWQHKTLMIV